MGHPCSHNIKIFFFLNSDFASSVVHKTFIIGPERWFVLNRLAQNETKTREITFSLLTNLPMSGVAVKLLGFFLNGILRQAYFAFYHSILALGIRLSDVTKVIVHQKESY